MTDPKLNESKEFFEKHLSKTSDLTNDRLKVLILGGPKTGKTRLAATCPKPLVIDADRGTITLGDMDLDKVTTTSWDEMKSVVYFLARGEHDYETLFLDGINRLQASFLIELMRKNGKAEMNQHLWGIAKKEGLDFCEWINYLTERRKMHVIITCHSKVKQDDNGRVIESGPEIAGDFAKQLPKAVDVVGFTVAKEAKNKNAEGVDEEGVAYRVLTKPFESHMSAAGDRWTALTRNHLGIAFGGEAPGVCLPDVSKWIEGIAQRDPTGSSTKPSTRSTKSAKPATPTSDSSKESDPGPTAPSVEEEATPTETPKDEGDGKSTPVDDWPDAKEEEEPTELPEPDVLKKMILQLYADQKAQDAKQGTEFHKDITAVIREIVSKHGFKQVAQIEDSIVLDEIIQAINTKAEEFVF